MVYKIELRFNTVMWNESFHHASRPWMVVYTDNKNVVDIVKSQGTFITKTSSHNSYGEEHFEVYVTKLVKDDYGFERQQYSDLYLETLSEYQGELNDEERQWVENEEYKFDTLITIDAGDWNSKNCLNKIQEGLDLWEGI